MQELTDREQAVAKLTLAGFGTGEAAVKLGVSAAHVSSTKTGMIGKEPLLATLFALARQLHWGE